MTKYERRAHDKALRLSAKHPNDDYYIMRDDCYDDDYPEAYYVVSGSNRDIHGDTIGCEPVAVYCDGRRDD